MRQIGVAVSGTAGGKRHRDALSVLCEPHCRKMAPSELSDDEIAVVGKGVSDVDWVVASFDVVLPIFLVFGHDGMRVRGVE